MRNKLSISTLVFILLFSFNIIRSFSFAQTTNDKILTKDEQSRLQAISLAQLRLVSLLGEQKLKEALINIQENPKKPFPEELYNRWLDYFNMSETDPLKIIAKIDSDLFSHWQSLGLASSWGPTLMRSTLILILRGFVQRYQTLLFRASIEVSSAKEIIEEQSDWDIEYKIDSDAIRNYITELKSLIKRYIATKESNKILKSLKNVPVPLQREFLEDKIVKFIQTNRPTSESSPSFSLLKEFASLIRPHTTTGQDDKINSLFKEALKHLFLVFPESKKIIASKNIDTFLKINGRQSKSYLKLSGYLDALLSRERFLLYITGIIAQRDFDQSSFYYLPRENDYKNWDQHLGLWINKKNQNKKISHQAFFRKLLINLKQFEYSRKEFLRHVQDRGLIDNIFGKDNNDENSQDLNRAWKRTNYALSDIKDIGSPEIITKILDNRAKMSLNNASLLFEKDGDQIYWAGAAAILLPAIPLWGAHYGITKGAYIVGSILITGAVVKGTAHFIYRGLFTNTQSVNIKTFFNELIPELCYTIPWLTIAPAAIGGTIKILPKILSKTYNKLLVVSPSFMHGYLKGAKAIAPIISANKTKIYYGILAGLGGYTIYNGISGYQSLKNGNPEGGIQLMDSMIDMAMILGIVGTVKYLSNTNTNTPPKEQNLSKLTPDTPPSNAGFKATSSGIKTNMPNGGSNKPIIIHQEPSFYSPQNSSPFASSMKSSTNIATLPMTSTRTQTTLATITKGKTIWMVKPEIIASKAIKPPVLVPQSAKFPTTTKIPLLIPPVKTDNKHSLVDDLLNQNKLFLAPVQAENNQIKIIKTYQDDKFNGYLIYQYDENNKLLFTRFILTPASIPETTLKSLFINTQDASLPKINSTVNMMNANGSAGSVSIPLRMHRGEKKSKSQSSPMYVADGNTVKKVKPHNTDTQPRQRSFKILMGGKSSTSNDTRKFFPVKIHNEKDSLVDDLFNQNKLPLEINTIKNSRIKIIKTYQDGTQNGYLVYHYDKNNKLLFVRFILTSASIPEATLRSLVTTGQKVSSPDISLSVNGMSSGFFSQPVNSSTSSTNESSTKRPTRKERKRARNERKRKNQLSDEEARAKGGRERKHERDVDAKQRRGKSECERRGKIPENYHEKSDKKLEKQRKVKRQMSDGTFKLKFCSWKHSQRGEYQSGTRTGEKIKLLGGLHFKEEVFNFLRVHIGNFTESDITVELLRPNELNLRSISYLNAGNNILNTSDNIQITMWEYVNGVIEFRLPAHFMATNEETIKTVWPDKWGKGEELRKQIIEASNHIMQEAYNNPTSYNAKPDGRIEIDGNYQGIDIRIVAEFDGKIVTIFPKKAP